MVDNISLPVMVPSRLLISPGVWNDNEYSAKEIEDGFARTNWGDKTKVSLWLNHDDRNASAFVGYVKNPTLASEGRVFGDLEIWDEKTAILLTKAMAKFGISAKIKGDEDKGGKMHNFTFENFSVVTVPACSDAYINLSKKEELISKYLISNNEIEDMLEPDDIEEQKIEEELLPEKVELAEVTAREAERKRRGMTPAQFYAVPRDPPSSSSLPIFDKAHVQNAMARFNQTNFKSPAEKATAKRKITAAANKFGIIVSDKFKSLFDIDVRRLKIDNMTEEEEKEEVVEEVKEEVVEEKVEEELSEKDLLKSLCDKFDKLVTLLSKKLEEEEKPEEVKEEPVVEEPVVEEPVVEPVEEPKVEEELISIKKELAEMREKLNAPRSKTVRNLSSNSVVEAKFDENKFCDLLETLDKPMRFK